MIELYTKDQIKKVYFEIKTKKYLDRQKKLPIGLDGVTTDIFERNLEFSINEIHRKLLSHDGIIHYHFGPLLRIERTKSEGGLRLLHIPRLRDQIVFRLIHDEIQHLSHVKGLDLKLKSPYSFVTRFDDYIANIETPVILKTDISKFYDSIPRDRAISLCTDIHLRPEIMQLLFKWSEDLSIKQTNFNLQVNNESTAGLPQGLSISSLLAEFYAKQIDYDFTHHAGYFRYIDDFVFICQHVNEAKDILAQLKNKVTQLGLELSPTKTEIVDFSRGIQWLGLFHYPHGKYMHPEKLIRAVKPIQSIQKHCLLQLDNTRTDTEKTDLIRDCIKKIDTFTSGTRNVRLKWYSLCVNQGQWKLMDKQIHGLIRSCIRKARLNESLFPSLPSIHAKVMSYKLQEKSQYLPMKGNAPTVVKQIKPIKGVQR